MNQNADRNVRAAPVGKGCSVTCGEGIIRATENRNKEEPQAGEMPDNPGA
jgi:hypothetical protein